MANIRSIHFEDFKRFAQFSVACKPTNIFVGPNNAGKSTTLDALRIFADFHRYALRTLPKPSTQEGFGVCATYFMPHTAIGVRIDNIVRDYGSDPAKITVKVDNDVAIHIRLHPDNTIVAFLECDGKIPKTKADYQKRVPIDLIVVPTLSALEEDEPFVTDETSNKNQNTRLASRNFRNILYRKTDDDFSAFANLCQEGWPNLKLEKPILVHGPKTTVSMLYEEDRIPREVCWSGFGFQIWMQMMAQFMRGSDKAILVLDEPDIYLHPDLQRKIIRMAKTRFSQIFVATHSTEIINESDPGDILSISSENKKAVRITTDDGYKKIFSYLGTSENAEFARLARAKRIVFFEGQERNIIRKYSRKVGLDAIFDDGQTVYLQAGGFSQWSRVQEIDWALQNIFELDIKVGALFDRDFRSDDEIAAFEQKLSNKHLWVGVLKQKEIENYAFQVESLIRTIQKRLQLRGVHLERDEIFLKLEELLNDYKEEVRSQRIGSYVTYHTTKSKNIDIATHLYTANAEFDGNWANIEGRFSLVGGKSFISTLSSYFQREFQTSITIHQLIDEMHSDEIDSELVEKMRSLGEFFK